MAWVFETGPSFLGYDFVVQMTAEISLHLELMPWGYFRFPGPCHLAHAFCKLPHVNFWLPHFTTHDASVLSHVSSYVKLAFCLSFHSSASMHTHPPMHTRPFVYVCSTVLHVCMWTCQKGLGWSRRFNAAIFLFLSLSPALLSGHTKPKELSQWVYEEYRVSRCKNRWLWENDILKMECSANEKAKVFCKLFLITTFRKKIWHHSPVHASIHMIQAKVSWKNILITRNTLGYFLFYFIF